MLTAIRQGILQAHNKRPVSITQCGPASVRFSALRVHRIDPSRRTRYIRPDTARASKPDDEVERLVKEADQGPGLGDSEAFGIFLKLAAAAAVVTTFVLLAQLAQPVVDNTLASFPVVASGGVDAGSDAAADVQAGF